MPKTLPIKSIGFFIIPKDIKIELTGPPVENKVKNNKPSPIQLVCHTWLRELGYTVEISTSTKDAIEKIFKVTVEEVRTINVHPRKKRVGRYTGLTNRKKKAIVRLADGQSINLG